MNFKIESYLNPSLPLGTSRLDVIMSINASNSESSYRMNGSKRVVGFVIDNSGSMDGMKLYAAKTALNKCIEAIPEDCYFFVVAFNSSAKVIVPLTIATKIAKSDAYVKIGRVSSGGGTIMSKALYTVLEQFAKKESAINYAFFVTDGQNDEGDVGKLKDALACCEGKFQCDCWGIGTDWYPNELRKISSRLIGTADAAPDIEMLENKFIDSLGKAMSKGIGDVRLRLQTPKTSRVSTIKQVSPEIVDLSILCKKIDEKNIDVPIGSWGDETREYYVVFELTPQGENEQMMACKPKVVYTDGISEIEVEGERIVAVWSSDDYLTSRINKNVAEYNGQQEMADCINRGLEAKRLNNIDEATQLLGKAAKLADQSGNEEVTERIKKVVEIVDAETGTVRLKASNKAADLELEMGSTMTVRHGRRVN